MSFSLPLCLAAALAAGTMVPALAGGEQTDTTTPAAPTKRADHLGGLKVSAAAGSSIMGLIAIGIIGNDDDTFSTPAQTK